MGAWLICVACGSRQVPPAERTVADEQAAKLDAMMEVTLEHLHSRVASGTAAAAWSTLLAALERTLLPTQRSKFTQFLLFYLARQVCCDLMCSFVSRIGSYTLSLSLFVVWSDYKCPCLHHVCAHSMRCIGWGRAVSIFDSFLIFGHMRIG